MGSIFNVPVDNCDSLVLNEDFKLSFIYIHQNCETAIFREKKSGNFGILGHGKPGKVREFHLPEVLTTLKNLSLS